MNSIKHLKNSIKLKFFDFYFEKIDVETERYIEKKNFSQLILEFRKRISPSKLFNVEELYKKSENDKVTRFVIPTSFVTRILNDYLIDEAPELKGRNEVLQRLRAFGLENNSVVDVETKARVKTKNAKKIRLTINAADSLVFLFKRNQQKMKYDQLFLAGDYFVDDKIKEVVN